MVRLLLLDCVGFGIEDNTKTKGLQLEIGTRILHKGSSANSIDSHGLATL